MTFTGGTLITTQKIILLNMYVYFFHFLLKSSHFKKHFLHLKNASKVYVSKVEHMF